MKDAKPVSSPGDPSNKLTKDVSPTSEEEKERDTDSCGHP